MHSCPITVMSGRAQLECSCSHTRQLRREFGCMSPDTGTETHSQTVVVGVDSHKATHYAAVLTEQGALLAVHPFDASTDGYSQLYQWVQTFGVVAKFGVECTGSFAAGLTRFLVARGADVAEVNVPHRHTRARRGKSDSIDAETAARHVLTGAARILPKVTTGVVESIRMLLLTRDSAVGARTVALQQLQDVLVTAPSQLREQMNFKRGKGAVKGCSQLQPDLAKLHEPMHGAMSVLRSLALRINDLNQEISRLDGQLDALVASTAPTLKSAMGIGTVNGAQLIVTAGENIGRLRSEAAFARLCGVAPIPASSGKNSRMRLHRGGDRRANRALYMIAVCRLRYDQRSIDYVTRRTTEGLSKRDGIRCLKRYIAREVYQALVSDLTADKLKQQSCTT